MENIIKCKNYEKCSASICPALSDEENKNYFWFSDEEVCRLRKDVPNWVLQQREIVKSAKPENNWHYFTLDMLKALFRVKRSVIGIDPNDVDEKRQLKMWFKNYNRTKENKKSAVTKEQKENSITVAREVREEKLRGGFTVALVGDG
jgi:hypothetical protein